MENRLKPTKGHFFSYRVWDESLMTKYIFEAVFVLWSAYVLYNTVTTALNQSLSNNEFEEEMDLNREQYDATNDPVQRAALDVRHTELLDIQEQNVKDLYYELVNILTVSFVLSLDWVVPFPLSL